MKQALFAVLFLTGQFVFADAQLDVPKVDYLSCAKVSIDVLPSERMAPTKSGFIEVERVCLAKVDRALTYVFEDSNRNGVIYRADANSQAFKIGEHSQGKVTWASVQDTRTAVGRLVPVFRLIKAGTAKRIEGLSVQLKNLKLTLSGFKDQTFDYPVPAVVENPAPVRIP